MRDANLQVERYFDQMRNTNANARTIKLARGCQLSKTIVQIVKISAHLTIAEAKTVKLTIG
jgi:hypothetical protein